MNKVPDFCSQFLRQFKKGAGTVLIPIQKQLISQLDKNSFSRFREKETHQNGRLINRKSGSNQRLKSLTFCQNEKQNVVLQKIRFLYLNVGTSGKVCRMRYRQVLGCLLNCTKLLKSSQYSPLAQSCGNSHFI